MIAFVLSECYEADPTFDYATVRRREGPIWKLVTEKPLHLLDPQYATWDEMMLVDDRCRSSRRPERDRSGALGDRKWSEYNVIAYRHPLSAGAAVCRPLARHADHDRCRRSLHDPGAFGLARRVRADGRLAGHEAEGIMHMPTGQSGHPLSPFYSNSHEAWVNGDPTPFLPGTA